MTQTPRARACTQHSSLALPSVSRAARACRLGPPRGGRALLAGGVLAYFELGGRPLWLLLLLLVPDVSMVGYLGGPRLGALTYNLAHNLVAGIGVLLGGWYADATPVAIVGAVLIAHVGMDRALGYGLKLPTDFKDTHLGRIGRPSP